MTRQILGSLALACLSAGCSLMSPYSEEFTCHKGVGFGSCSSVSENYKQIYNTSEIDLDQPLTITELSSLKNDKKEPCALLRCSEMDLIQALWLRQRKLEQQLQGIKHD